MLCVNLKQSFIEQCIDFKGIIENFKIILFSYVIISHTSYSSTCDMQRKKHNNNIVYLFKIIYLFVKKINK